MLGVDLLRPIPGEAPVAATPGSVAADAQTPDPWVLVNGHGAFVSARLAQKNGWKRGSTIAAIASAAGSGGIA